MQWIEDIPALEALYGTPGPASTEKVASALTPLYRRWIAAARFCVLTTVGPEGTDGSPRGDDGPVVRELDPKTLAMPDWHGNNRIDSLRNIMRDGRVSLMFMVSGSTSVVRVNGRARLTADEALRTEFTFKGKLPRSVIVISIGEVYFQCARAILRSGLWTSDDLSGALPTAGEMLAEASKGQVGGPGYDAEWPERAAKTMW
jgi:PPOX class probable FMN-dependent enzyme